MNGGLLHEALFGLTEIGESTGRQYDIRLCTSRQPTSVHVKSRK